MSNNLDINNVQDSTLVLPIWGFSSQVKSSKIKNAPLKLVNFAKTN